MTTYHWATSSAAGLKIEVNDDWHEAKDGDRMVLTSPANDVQILLDFVSKGAAEGQADEKAMMDKLARSLTAPPVIEPGAPRAQHGLTGYGVHGTGVAKTGPIHWFTFSFGDGKGHGVMGLAMGAPDKMLANQDAMKRIVASIQPAI